jgi:hypothetical protein
MTLCFVDGLDPVGVVVLSSPLLPWSLMPALLSPTP